MAAWPSANRVTHLNRVTLSRAQLVLKLVTVQLYRPGQLSLLPSAEREMSTTQSVVMLCS